MAATMRWLLAGMGFAGGVAAVRAMRSMRKMNGVKPQPDHVEFNEISGETKFGESSGNGFRHEELL